MPIDKVAVDLTEPASVTSKVMLCAPVVVGFPVMAPVELFRWSPAGRGPLATDHEYGWVPPVAERVCV